VHQPISLTRRRLCLVAGLSGLAGPAFAAFPERPIRIVIGFPPASATDIATRIIAAKMSSELGQQVIVENKPGASTNIAAMQVAKSAADGYTLFVAGNTNSVNPSLRKDTPIDMEKDLEPIGLAVTVPSILVVVPGLKVESVADLAQMVRANPGKVLFASSGNGTVSHLAGELFANSVGGKMVHVPYKGSSQAIFDLLGGNVQVMFAPASTVVGFIKEGKLRALATTASARSRLFPDLPTVAEAGVKNYDTRIWFGLTAPAGTSPAVKNALANALSRTLDDPEVVRQLAQQAIEPFRGDGPAYWKYMRDETQKWTAIVKSAGITAD
jgi:tripartite-type tricarboxylate transporter receptor subunit TctC